MASFHGPAGYHGRCILYEEARARRITKLALPPPLGSCGTRGAKNPSRKTEIIPKLTNNRAEFQQVSTVGSLKKTEIKFLVPTAAAGLNRLLNTDAHGTFHVPHTDERCRRVEVAAADETGLPPWKTTRLGNEELTLRRLCCQLVDLYFYSAPPRAHASEKTKNQRGRQRTNLAGATAAASSPCQETPRQA